MVEYLFYLHRLFLVIIGYKETERGLMGWKDTTKQPSKNLSTAIKRSSHDCDSLAGSLAHGFARPDADIDLILGVEEAEYQKEKPKATCFSLWIL